MITYHLTLRPYDKQNLYNNKMLIKELLFKNSTGVFNKEPIKQGLKLWNMQESVGQPLTKGRSPEFLDDTAYTVNPPPKKQKKSQKTIKLKNNKLKSLNIKKNW